jgi:hypothetical protein
LSSSALSGVQHLFFDTKDFPSGQDDVDGEQWLQLIRSFGNSRSISIDGELAIGILCALRQADEGNTTDTVVHPFLRNLRVRKLGLLDWPFWDAAQSLVASRELSSYPIELQFVCPNCDVGLGSRELKKHLEEQHNYEIFCSHCGDFQIKSWSTLEYIHRSQEHLRKKHPEVAGIYLVHDQEQSSWTLLDSWSCSWYFISLSFLEYSSEYY